MKNLSPRVQAIGWATLIGGGLSAFMSVFGLWMTGPVADLWPIIAVAYGLSTAFTVYTAVRSHYAKDPNGLAQT